MPSRYRARKVCVRLLVCDPPAVRHPRFPRTGHLAQGIGSELNLSGLALLVASRSQFTLQNAGFAFGIQVPRVRRPMTWGATHGSVSLCGQGHARRVRGLLGCLGEGTHEREELQVSDLVHDEQFGRRGLVVGVLRLFVVQAGAFQSPAGHTGSSITSQRVARCCRFTRAAGGEVG